MAQSSSPVHERQSDGPPDLRAGIASRELAEGQMLVGTFEGQSVLLARRGGEVFAVEATCTHAGGPLAEGLLVSDTVRCPWHHACFSLRDGRALRAPALRPLGCFAVEETQGRIVVRGRTTPALTLTRPTMGIRAIVIVGGGAAGHAAAEALRAEGYTGSITLVSADDAPPCDRPSLSKEYLSGQTPSDALPLRPPEFFHEQRIELVLNQRVTALDVRARRITLEDGRVLPFDRLLLATGAEPVRLTIPGAELAHVHYLRSLSEANALVAALEHTSRAVVIGGSFIGLEVAASLRARGIAVDVVTRDAVPLERVLGAELGAFVRSLHEQHGVRFHLERTAASIEPQRVLLDSGEALPADVVIAGIGVEPELGLARRAGLAIDRGIVVDPYLQTSTPGIFAAGDVARFPNPWGGEKLRLEHWVVAERMGQLAAQNMLGRCKRYHAVPFFWSQHYDVTISYVGHAAAWDRIEIRGNIAQKDARVTYFQGPRRLAVATIGRDHESLEAEIAFEGAL